VVEVLVCRVQRVIDLERARRLGKRSRHVNGTGEVARVTGRLSLLGIDSVPATSVVRVDSRAVSRAGVALYCVGVAVCVLTDDANRVGRLSENACARGVPAAIADEALLWACRTSVLKLVGRARVASVLRQ
jgi:hypothetical protein